MRAEVKDMSARWLGLFPVIGLVLTLPIAAQDSFTQQVFSITVTHPTNVKDVQLRYFLTDAAGKHRPSRVTQVNQRILIKAGPEVSVNSFRAIAYAPGCRVAMINVDDLSSGNRESQFKCEPLPALQLRGSAGTSGLDQRHLEVEALYRPGWASLFFEISASAVSPFSVAKAPVKSDGTFTIEIPDFGNDPLWPSLTHEADLVFFLVDADHRQRLALLTPPSDLSSREQFLKVLPSYPPELNFTVSPLNSLAYSKSSN
jgi:hypothetical protein